MVDEPAIREALESVVDPCSIAAGVPLSLADMGLLDSIVIEGGDVVVGLLPTGPGCMFAGALATAVQRELSALPGVRSAEVWINTETLWDPSRMAPAARDILSRRRARTIELAGVKPASAVRTP